MVEICVLGLVPVLKLILFGILLATVWQEAQTALLGESCSEHRATLSSPTKASGCAGLCLLEVS